MWQHYKPVGSQTYRCAVLEQASLHATKASCSRRLRRWLAARTRSQCLGELAASRRHSRNISACRALSRRRSWAALTAPRNACIPASSSCFSLRHGQLGSSSVKGSKQSALC